MTRFFSKVLFVSGLVGVMGIYLICKVWGREKTYHVLMNATLLLVTVILMILLGEGIVRFALRDITTTQYSGSYFSRKWADQYVQLNSLGFREKEPLPKKPQGTYRIVVIGDSFTFGQGIPEQDRFSNLIQKNLKSVNREFEVLNFGWVGVDTVRETGFLTKVLKSYEPDYILLQWFVNDVMDDEHLQTIPSRWALSPSRTLHRYLNYHSGLYYLMNEQVHAIQMNFGLAKQYDEYYRRTWKNANSEDSLKYKNALKEFIDKSHEANVPVGIVLFPKLLPNLGEGYPYQYVHDLVLQVCEEKAVTCLDLLDSLSTYSRPDTYTRLHVNRFDTHPSAMVNQVAADQIEKTFSPFWRGKVMQAKLPKKKPSQE